MLTRSSKTKTQVIKEIAENPSKGRFTITPLDPGYGITVGNSLRRIIFSSIDGYAITHVKFPSGVMHEFDTIEGVKEDVSNIILNLKAVRVKKINHYQGEKIVIEVRNQKVLKAGDIAKFTNAFEILNPEHVICEMDPSCEFSITIVLKKGRGYMRSEGHRAEHATLGFISIDASFTPIIRVTPQVQTTLVGQRTDYEKLILDIETDGSLTAEEALQQAAQSLTRYFSLLFDEKALVEEPEEEEAPANKEFLRMRQLLNTPLDALELLPRVHGSLDKKNIKNLADIVELTYSDLMKIRGFGKKSIKQLKELLHAKGLTLGMDVKKYKIETPIEE